MTRHYIEKLIENEKCAYVYWLNALLGAQIRLRKLMAEGDWLLAETQKDYYIVKYLHKVTECKANILRYCAMLGSKGA